MKSKIAVLLLSGTLVLFFGTSSYDQHMDDDNGKAGATGSPGEETCAESDCHTGTAVNGGPGEVTITSSNMPNWEYVPGQQYAISVVVSESGRDLFGLGVEALKSNGDNAGTLVAGTGTQIKSKNIQGFSRKSIVHNLNTGATSDLHTFTFTWNAPSTDVGDVTFYVAGNAANGNDDESGDHIYTTTQVVTAAVGIYELENDDINLTLGPNPATDYLNLSYSLTQSHHVEIRVIDTQGRIVRMLEQSNQTGEVKSRYDVADLPKGTYMLQLLLDQKISCCEVFQAL